MNTRSVAACLFVCVAALLVFSASASAQSWTNCASEGGTCTVSGTQQVRYGANGLYFYKTVTNSTACTNNVFGDPAPGVVKKCETAGSAEWTFCASEGGACAFSGMQQVRYGANGTYVYQTLTGGTACTNSVFGDPLYGVVKRCEVAGATSITDWTFCTAEGGACAFSGTQQVRYGANSSYFYKTLTGGTACTNSMFGDPAPGVLKRCDVSGTPSAAIVPPPPPPSTYGPSPAITCPAGAYDLWPGSNIPYLIGFQPAGTTYCVRAGVHYLTSAITPKRGDTFVGEYGATLDGTGWSTSDSTQAAFRAHNQDIDYVTIRNLVIRNMPQRGIHAYYMMADHWTIEYTEIANNKNTGLVFPGDSLVRNNAVHHNAYAGYIGSYAHNTTLEGNEIAYNGQEQKVHETNNVTFRNNFVHHNAGTGIWYDSHNTGGLIEGNRVEDNGLMGVFYEISSDGIIRNNTIRRSGEAGVMLSVSRNVQIYNNTLDSNFRGITFFLNCPSLAQSATFDLANNAAYDNTIIVGTRSGAWASLFSYLSCTSTQLAPFMNGSKNLTFSRNTYRVPSPTTGQYWLWGGFQYWNEWQSLGQDLNSTVSQ